MTSAQEKHWKKTFRLSQDSSIPICVTANFKLHADLYTLFFQLCATKKSQCMFTVAQDTWNEGRKTEGVAPMQRNLFIGIKRASFLSHVSKLYRVRKEAKWKKSLDLRGRGLTLEHLQGCHHQRSEAKRKGNNERMFVLVKFCMSHHHPYTREFSPKNHVLRLT